MKAGRLLAASTVVLGALPAWAQQPLPTTQPAIIQIIREFEKTGHSAAHEATEIRWTALNRSAAYPVSYLGLVAVSGASEAWWISTFTGLDAVGKAQAFGAGNPTYTASLNKIAMEDGDHLTGSSTTLAEAVPQASYGEFPDVRMVRVYSIMTVQVRPGGEAAITDIAHRYAALMKAKDVPTSWRTYSVVSGAPTGTFLIFSSFPSWEAVEANRKATAAAMSTANAADMDGFTKALRDGIVSMNVRYFNLNPRMSLVPKEMLSDPFWSGK